MKKEVDSLEVECTSIWKSERYFQPFILMKDENVISIGDVLIKADFLDRSFYILLYKKI